MMGRWLARPWCRTSSYWPASVRRGPRGWGEVSLVDTDRGTAAVSTVGGWSIPCDRERGSLTYYTVHHHYLVFTCVLQILLPSSEPIDDTTKYSHHGANTQMYAEITAYHSQLLSLFFSHDRGQKELKWTFRQPSMGTQLKIQLRACSCSLTKSLTIIWKCNFYSNTQTQSRPDPTHENKNKRNTRNDA